MWHVRNEVRGSLINSCCRNHSRALRHSFAPTVLWVSHCKTSRKSFQNCRFETRKHFSTSNNVSQDLATADAATSQSYNISFVPSSTRKNPLNSADSPIRKTLRAWSTEYKRTQKENAPENVVIGRKVSLPNSLFLSSEDQEERASRTQDDTLSALSEETDSEVSEAFFIRPRDLFQIKEPGLRLQWAIYVGEAGSQIQLFLQNGQWLQLEKRAFKSWPVRNFATQQEIEAIKACMPVKAVEAPRTEGGQIAAVNTLGNIPYRIAQPVLEKFAKVSREAEMFKRDNLQILENVYEMFADDKFFRNMSIHELIKEAFKTDLDLLSPGAQLIIFSTLVDYDFRIQVTVTSGHVNVSLLPRRLAQSMRNTAEWARLYQDAAAKAASGHNVSRDLESNPLTSFIKKARRLIVKSRKLRSPTTMGILGPAKSLSADLDQRPTGEIFDENDRQIIECMWNLFVRHPLNATLSNQPYRSVGALILRAVGAYPKLRLARVVGKLFLQEIGCMNPWDDPVNHYPNSPLSFTGLSKEAVEAAEHEQRALADLDRDSASSSLLTSSKISIPSRSYSLKVPFPDSAASFRKDWGDLEVLCIDSVSSRLIDDGVSVQAAANQPGHYWLHVHVAHPSAFVPYGHPFERRARLMASGFYGKTRKDFFMPSDLLECMGLAADRAALTISTLISPDGSVEDVEVTPSIVRNVIRISKEAWVERYGSIVSNGSRKFTFTVGDSSFAKLLEQNPEHDAARQLVQKHSTTLELMERLSALRSAARQRENLDYLRLESTRYFSDVQVSHRESGYGHDRLFQSLHTYSDPYIYVSCALEPGSGSLSKQISTDVVSSSMVIAGESIGLWMRKNGIPGIYQGTRLPPSFPLTKLNNLGRHEGYIAPTTFISATPTPHLGYNVKQYMPIASPLRRYHDLLLHYQIDSYLKAWTSGLVSPGSPIADESILTFSTNHIRQEVDITSRFAAMTNLRIVSESHWKAQALFRAFHFNQAKLPEVWDVEIDNPVQLSLRKDFESIVTGVLVPFRLKASIVASEQGFEKQAKFHQFLPVKIEQVNPDNFTVTCRAVGPATDEPLSSLEVTS